MTQWRKYGVGALFSTVLIDGAGDPPGLIFAGPTLVAGDLKRSTDLLALGNLTAEYGAFTSGGTGSPAVGDTLTGATSTQTCVVIGYKLTSGTWAGGDAAGYIFVEQVSGAFSNENLNNTTQSANDQLTLTADFTPSIGGLAISDEIWLALTSAEMTCKQGMVLIEDQAATVWAADGIPFETYGHASALHAFDLGLAIQPVNITQSNGVAIENTDGTASAGGASSITLEAGSVNTADYWKGRKITITDGTGAGQERIITASSTASPPVCTVHRPWVTQPDNTSTYVFGGSGDANLYLLNDTHDGVEAMSYAVDAIAWGTVDTGATTTVIPIKTLNTTISIDKLNGRVLLFPNRTATANLRGQGGSISDMDGTSITLSTALTNAPAEDDIFVVQ